MKVKKKPKNTKYSKKIIGQGRDKLLEVLKQTLSDEKFDEINKVLLDKEVISQKNGTFYNTKRTTSLFLVEDKNGKTWYPSMTWIPYPERKKKGIKIDKSDKMVEFEKRYIGLKEDYIGKVETE